ncbi:hypothetical protein, partial [Neisseria polysaccharea]
SVQSEPGSNSYVQSLTYNFWSASKKPTGQCSKHYLVCLSNSVRPKALTLIGNLFVKERLNCFITTVSSVAKNRTIRLKRFAVNRFLEKFL